MQGGALPISNGMKILLTGGGTGGHFYPLIAVAEEINRIAREKNLLKPELYFLSDREYDPKALFNNDITFKKVPAGKLRRYFSIQNFFDIFKTIAGTVKAIFTVFWMYPDVIFSKGGYGSFPAVVAARILRIPLFIHESDSVPGRANKQAGKFARKIAVSYPEAAPFFPIDKVAWTGNPVRKGIQTPLNEGAHQLLQFDRTIPTILVLGGSLGAEFINNAILDSLKDLVSNYQVIHQAGRNNIAVVSGVSQEILKGNQNANRYKVFDYLDDDSLRAAAGAADLILSRAGSAIFEIALWGKPSIIIPITDTNGDHQRKNAVAYEKAGACLVIEEANLKPHILLSEIGRILGDKALVAQMSENARTFAKPDAAEKIARAILSIALKHEV